MIFKIGLIGLIAILITSPLNASKMSRSLVSLVTFMCWPNLVQRPPQSTLLRMVLRGRPLRVMLQMGLALGRLQFGQCAELKSFAWGLRPLAPPSLDPIFMLGKSAPLHMFQSNLHFFGPACGLLRLCALFVCRSSSSLIALQLGTGLCAGSLCTYI